MIQLGLGLTIPLNDGFGNGGSSPPPYPTGVELEDGSGLIELEDGSGVIELETGP